jgi:8-oxo-dGTP pyrophosphatase MutT (NUDIX family)
MTTPTLLTTPKPTPPKPTLTPTRTPTTEPGGDLVVSDGWPAVRERVAAHTDRVLADLRSAWPDAREAAAFELGPRGHDPDAPPDSVPDQLDLCAGVASVVLFETPAHERAVLVYNPGGFWEPPGGVVEADQTPAAAARVEAREETGLDVELTDLWSAGRFTFRYGDGSAVPLPAATFVGHRTGGRLRPETERTDHPGATRAVGVFDDDVFPEPCRAAETVRRLLE